MARFCRECGKELRDDALFCGGCGAKMGGVPTAGPSSAPVPPRPTGGVQTMPVAPTVRAAAAPPPPPGAVPTIPAAPGPAPGPAIPQAYAAPAASPPAAQTESTSSLVLKGRELAAKLHQSVPPTTQMGAILDRCLRAAFLDPDVYRQAALDPRQNTEAGIVAAASLFFVSAGTSILTILSGNLNLTLMIGLLLVQAAGFAAFIFGAAYSATFVAGIKVDPLALFRSVSWGQAIGVLGVLPVVGSLISLWRIPTTIVAIRDGFGLDLTKAMTLAVIGAVCGAVASAVMSPIVFGLLGGGRGFLP